MSPQEALETYWGYPAFRPLQEEIITEVLEGKDVLALLPTGGGKSICYQVPAVVSPGLCLVVSPLIALMNDQAERLRKLNIPALAVHSGMSAHEVRKELSSAVEGAYKLLYVSPERLNSWQFRGYLTEIDVSLLAVDEAHCVSQWGHDFRPDYLKIKEIRAIFPNVPMLALTATATGDVAKDISRQLKLEKPVVFKQSFARPEITIEVCYTENKNLDLVQAIDSKVCNIVYTRSRKTTEVVSKMLQSSNISAAMYHAGMATADRVSAQQKWMTGEVGTMVATTAFGMGIDKPDVRLVAHYDAPEQLEAWYQEAGRAARDGQPARVLTMYNQKDIERLLNSIDVQYPEEAYLRKVYQKVADYLQIPTGTQPEKYFPFDLNEFCARFGLEPTPAIYALKVLEREGLWTMTDAIYCPSTVQFCVNRHVLDELADHNPRLGYITVGLLRLFNSIFYYPTPIREPHIARLLKIKTEELVKDLQQLHQMEILHYNKAIDGPQLWFHSERVNSSHLHINMKRLRQLRERHLARTQAMIAFLENTTECREAMALKYFGEKAPKACRHCDVCLKKMARQADYRQQILDALTSGPLTVSALTRLYEPWLKDEIINNLRQLMEEGSVGFDGDTVRKLA